MNTINFGQLPTALVGENDGSVVNPSSNKIPEASQAVPGVEYGLLPITGHKLNGQNYNLWSHSVLIFIRGKGKEDYLSNANKQPAETSPLYKQWKAENNMVMSWLINSMTSEIGEQFIFYCTAAEIWDAAQETFSNKENTSVIFEIKGLLHDLRQGESTVTGYYTALTRYWQQLDSLDTHLWNCAADGKLYKLILETDRIYQFLHGLNRDLDEVRGRVLGTKPLPSLREVFAEVRREESRRKVMLGTVVESPNNSDGSALVARFSNSRNSIGTSNSHKKSGRPWCEHCKRPGHTKETCWKLHGKPTDWKSNARSNQDGGSHGNVAVSEPFSREQVEALQRILHNTLGKQLNSYCGTTKQCLVCSNQ